MGAEVEGQQLWYNAAEVRALKHGSVKNNAIALAAYYKIKQKRKYKLKTWTTNRGAFAKLLGLKGEAGKKRLDRALDKLIEVGLLTKRANEFDKGLVFTLPLACVFDGDNVLITSGTTSLPTSGTTSPLAYATKAATTGINEPEENDSVRDNVTTSGGDIVVTTSPLSISNTNNNNNKNAHGSLGPVDFENADPESLVAEAEATLERLEQSRGSGSANEQKKISAKTEVQHSHGPHVASGDADVERTTNSSGAASVIRPVTTNSPATVELTTNSAGATPGPTAGASGGGLTDDEFAGIGELTNYFLTKPGIKKLDIRGCDIMPQMLKNGLFNSQFSSWLRGGLTAADVIQLCELNDKQRGEFAWSPKYYDVAIQRWIEAKKNPPVHDSRAGKMSGSHSQVRGKHNDPRVVKSQPTNDRFQNMRPHRAAQKETT